MSFRTKLIISILLLLALSFSIGGALIITTSFNESLEKETQEALDSFVTIRDTLYLLNSLESQASYNSLAGTLSRMEAQGFEDWQALTLKAEDKVIYQSGIISEAYLEMLDISDEKCSYEHINDNNGDSLLVAGIISTGEAALELAVRFELSEVYEMKETQQRLYFTIYIIIISLGALASVAISIMLTNPLNRLTGTVRQISDGDLSKRSGLTSKDEFGQLSRDFDAMADKLCENISRLEADMQRQERFMGAFAHELKTPMTSIMGFAELLRQGDLDENTRMMAADYIYTEGRRLERLSFKLLDLLLLKNDDIIMKPVWLKAFIDEIEQAMTPVLKQRGIRLFCRAEKEQVTMEPDLVKSLLYNLIDNASKAIDGEGLIGVKAMAIPNGCQFQIVDNGRGMEQTELTRITEEFYRVDKARSRSQGGAGLGLALCRQIVELHNGSMSFASKPQKGTRVTVTLYGGKEIQDA